MRRALFLAALVAALTPAAQSATTNPISTAAEARAVLGSSQKGDIWWKLAKSEKWIVAHVYLLDYAPQLRSRINASAVRAEVDRQIAEGALDRDGEGKQPLRVMLRFPAQTAYNLSIFEAKRKWLPTRRLIGKTQREVRRILGPPARTRTTATATYWFYELMDNLYRLTIRDGRVVAQLKQAGAAPG